MATYGGSNFVTNGLVLALDAANPRSYVSGSLSWRDLASASTGSLVNGPVFTTASYGSILFDGVDDYCNLMGDNRLTVPTLTITSVFKAYSYQNNGVCIFTRENARLNLGIFYGGATGSYFFVRGDNYLSTGAELNGVYKPYPFLLNTWYHLTYVVDIPGNNYKCYVNGSQIFSTGSVLGSTWADTVSINNSIIAARYYGTSVYSNIEVGNFFFYNRVLTDSEILQNYNATKGRYGL